MIRKRIQRIASFYFCFAFGMMLVCAGNVAVDCVNKARTGEFKILPVLNLAQYKVGDTLEENYETVPQVTEYAWQLFENGYGPADPMWQFIDSCTVCTLCGIPLFHLLHLAGIRFSSRTRGAMLAGWAVALGLIFAARLFVIGNYCGSELRSRFPTAWTSWRELALAAILLGGITGVVKLLTRKGPEDE